ncbi:hypothetical protein FA15DRAFT_249403 [Coprinopsis marcescibilis]|uniref:Uncharacterized protein n=1 Tax=Coprinopsis marcescibilis TaxID=230819 RepID=A0A5C3KEZ3_COPMA|nr:hypothetical protein FA15DRAFT_249403 [Coprinopsis marcescibilis]
MIIAEDPFHFSLQSGTTIAFQAKELAVIATRVCTIRFMFIKLMVRFSIDLQRSIVVHTYPVMPAPWIFLTLLDEWASGKANNRKAEKKKTKDFLRVLGETCAGGRGGPDWAEFDIALASFPHAKEQLAMLKDVYKAKTHLKLIRQNTSISAPPPALNNVLSVPREVPPVLFRHHNAVSTHPSASHSLSDTSNIVTSTGIIPKTQSVHSPYIYSTPSQTSSSMLRIPPGDPPVVFRHPNTVPTHRSASHSLPNKSSASTTSPTAMEPIPHTIPLGCYSSMPYIPPLSAGVPHLVDRSLDLIPTRPSAFHSLPNRPSTFTTAPTAMEPIPRPVPLECYVMTDTGLALSKAYIFLVQLDAWARETRGSTEALCSAWDAFVEDENWSELDVALKWFPDAKWKLDKFQFATFPHLSCKWKQFDQIRKKASKASQQVKAGQKSVERQPVSAATTSRSVPVKITEPLPVPSMPPPSSKLTSLADPPRDSSRVPSPPEPGLGPHNHTSTLTTIAWDVVDTLRESGFRCAFFGSMGCRLYGNTRLPEILHRTWTCWSFPLLPPLPIQKLSRKPWLLGTVSSSRRLW